MRQKEILSLTSLRALAAALVFAFHYSQSPTHVIPSGFLSVIIRQGYVGIDLFFVLSGFILTVRYFQEVADHTFNIGKYFQRRIARIYPLYFTILALTLLLTHQPPHITSLTLTQGFFVDYFSLGISTSWTLTVEECFYLIFPLMLLTVIPARRPTQIVLTLLAWIVGFIVIGFVLMTWVRQSGVYLQAGFLGKPDIDPLYPFSFTIFGYIFDFSVGIFVAIPYLKGIKWKSWQSTLLAIIAIVGILYCQNFIDVRNGTISSERMIVYLLALFAGLLILTLTCETAPLSRFLSWKVFVYLGRVSFALYLIQNTVLIDFMRGWDLVPFYIGANVMCAVFYQFVEEPGRRAVMNFRFRRVRQPEVISA